MKDANKAKSQLVGELDELRPGILAREAADACGSETSETQRERDLVQTNQRLQRELAELRRVEENLLQAEKRWERTFDSTPDLIAIIDTEYRIVQANQAMARRLRRTPDQCIGLRCFEAIHGRSEPPDFCPHARTLADRQEHCVEIREVNLEGDFLVSVSPLFDEQGQLLGSVHVAHDITQRKQAEEALQQSEEKYKRLIEACPDAVVVADLEGKILFASGQTRSVVGVAESEELVGRSLFDCVVPDQRNQTAANIAQLKEVGVRRNTEYTGLRPDGATFSIEVSSAIVRNAAGEPQAIMAVIRDIMSRKKADETLRQHNDQLETIYGGIVEGLAITDIETKRFLRVNSSMCRMLGYSEEELLKASVQDIHPPEEVADDLQRFQATAEGRESINENRPVLRKDGSIFYADITGRRIVYEGRPCLLALFRDVTERRAAQAALQRERHTLKHMLRASDHERQLIAYDIHDGLAQQLAAAIMQFQTYDLLKQADSKEAQKAYDGGLTLLRQGHFEARRLISGVRPPILDESGVVAAIAHLVNEESLKGSPQIIFHSSVMFNRLAVVLENVIYRIIQESVTNASKHSGSELVRVILRQRGHSLHIEVRDWGVGFDPKAVEANRFGLSGIRQRARLLGGKCRIRSKPDRGARVTVELPLAEREIAEE